MSVSLGAVFSVARTHLARLEIADRYGGRNRCRICRGKLIRTRRGASARVKRNCAPEQALALPEKSRHRGRKDNGQETDEREVCGSALNSRDIFRARWQQQRQRRLFINANANSDSDNSRSRGLARAKFIIVSGVNAARAILIFAHRFPRIN